MIDLHYWTTPNGHKITIFLEETGLPYRITPVNIGKGEQFNPEFLAISPNNRIPAIVDEDPKDGGAPISVFESGAILLYLAEKTGKFIPSDIRGRVEVLQWLFWQIGGLGPMAGQNHHFGTYAPEKIPYAIDRYRNETNRLYGVLNKRLADRPFLAGDYSIADMASYPWIVPHERQGQRLEDFPNLKRWFETIRQRPATKRAYEKAAKINRRRTSIRIRRRSCSAKPQRIWARHDKLQWSPTSTIRVVLATLSASCTMMKRWINCAKSGSSLSMRSSASLESRASRQFPSARTDAVRTPPRKRAISPVTAPGEDVCRRRGAAPSRSSSAVTCPVSTKNIASAGSPRCINTSFGCNSTRSR